MLKQRAKEIGLMVAACDVALLVFAFAAACFFRFTMVDLLRDADVATRFKPYAWILWVSVPLLLFLFRQAGLYESLRRKSYGEVVWLTMRPFLIAAGLMGLAIFLVQDKSYSRPVFFAYFLFSALLVGAEKVILKHLAFQARLRGYNTRTVLIIGAGKDAVNIADELRDSPEYGYQVLGHLVGYDLQLTDTGRAAVLGHVKDLEVHLDIHAIDEVVVAVPHSDLPRYEQHIRQCELVGIRVHVKIDPIISQFGRTYVSEFGRYPILTLTSTPHDPLKVVLKRTIDMALSATAIVLVAPILAATWLTVRLTSPGPALFRQVRGGLNGRRFVLYKFRSMYANAEERLAELRDRNEMSGPVFKITRDPRVTLVGRFIRKWSIDELPQLFNVLKGDMSLVGPRPPIPTEVDQYERWQKRRLSMKPGLTCLWQVNGRNHVDFDEWMRLDMQYIDDWSLGLDMKILAKTVPAVLFARGAR